MSVSRPTLADVAAHAGVSISTASIAFSDTGSIAEGTRARILDSAQALGYAGPSALGRQLRSGRTRWQGGPRRRVRLTRLVGMGNGPLDSGEMLIPLGCFYP